VIEVNGGIGSGEGNARRFDGLEVTFDPLEVGARRLASSTWRLRARTWNPAASRAKAAWRPTKPEAPVSRRVGWFM
jgi:hypothetical protein